MRLRILSLVASLALVACNASDSASGQNNQPLPPELATMSFSLDEDSSVSFSLTSGVKSGTPTEYFVESEPEYGSLSGTAPNLTYHPSADFYGTDSITFSVSSTEGRSESVDFVFTVEAMQDLPVIGTQLDSYLPAGASSIALAITDSDGDELSVNVLPQSDLVSSASYSNGIISITSESVSAPESIELIVEVSDGHGVVKSTLQADLLPLISVTGEKAAPWGSAIGELVVAQSNPQDVYFFPEAGGYLYTSSDSGTTWDRVNSPGVTNVQVSPFKSSLLMALKDGWLVKSSDSGATWSDAELTQPSQADQPKRFAFDLKNPTVMYAHVEPKQNDFFGDKYSVILYVSSDLGRTWESVRTFESSDYIAITSSALESIDCANSCFYSLLNHSGYFTATPPLKELWVTKLVAGTWQSEKYTGLLEKTDFIDQKTLTINAVGPDPVSLSSVRMVSGGIAYALSGQSDVTIISLSHAAYTRLGEGVFYSSNTEAAGNGQWLRYYENGSLYKAFIDADIFNETDLAAIVLTDEAGLLLRDATLYSLSLPTKSVATDVADYMDAPFLDDVSLEVDINSETTVNFSAAYQAPIALDYHIESQPLSGSAEVFDNGSLVFRSGSQEETVVFNVYAEDDFVRSNSATVTIIVKDIEHEPVASEASFSLIAGMPLSDVLQGIDDDGDALTYELVEDVKHGSLNLLPSGEFTYTPALDFIGADTFTYAVNDDKSTSTPGTITLNVTALSDLISTSTGASVVNINGMLQYGSQLWYSVTNESGTSLELTSFEAIDDLGKSIVYSTEQSLLGDGDFVDGEYVGLTVTIGRLGAALPVTGVFTVLNPVTQQSTDIEIVID